MLVNPKKLPKEKHWYQHWVKIGNFKNKYLLLRYRHTCHLDVDHADSQPPEPFSIYDPDGGI